LSLSRLIEELVGSRADLRVLVISWAKSELAAMLEQRGNNSTLIRLSGQPAHDPLTPSSDEHFDVIVCEETGRRVKDAAMLIYSCARALHPGGSLILWDLVITGPPKSARYVNTLEAFRDPAHEWAYSPEDWETFLTLAGLEVTRAETFTTRLTIDAWAEGYLANRGDLLRAHVLVQRAPPDAAQMLKPLLVGQTSTFERTFVLVVAKKPTARS